MSCIITVIVRIDLLKLFDNVNNALHNNCALMQSNIIFTFRHYCIDNAPCFDIIGIDTGGVPSCKNHVCLGLGHRRSKN